VRLPVAMKQRAQLIVNVPVKGEPMVYQCSVCGQVFRLAEERTPKQAMAEIWAAFQDHIREGHPEDGTSSMAH